MLARHLIATAALAALLGCGSGGNEAISNYGGIDGTSKPATGSPASGAGPEAPGTATPPPSAAAGTSAEAPAVRRPIKPGDPGGLTKEQLAAGVTPWDKKKAGAANASGEPYTVPKGGESLYSIARKMLGSESRWKQLYEANRGVVGDPEKVAAGTVIYPPTRRSAKKKFRGLTDGLD